MNGLAGDESDNPCLLLTGASIGDLKESAHNIIAYLEHPVWHISPRDSDMDILKTLENLSRDRSDRKLLIFHGNTHKFSKDTGIEMLSNFFWYPNLYQTQTTLVILVESVTQSDFYRPLLTAKYHLDVGIGHLYYGDESLHCADSKWRYNLIKAA